MDGDSIQRKLNLVFFNVITVLKHKDEEGFFTPS